MDSARISLRARSFFLFLFFFFSIESQNVLLERANLFDFPNSVEFERIPRFICFLLKKKERENFRGKIISLLSKTCVTRDYYNQLEDRSGPEWLVTIRSMFEIFN